MSFSKCVPYIKPYLMKQDWETGTNKEMNIRINKAQITMPIGTGSKKRPAGPGKGYL